ncbi:MAG: hypothetical protein IJH03_02830, partial [Clostridia bacterium]|nr:hypothetical protein [Clostridia bacterium]
CSGGNLPPRHSYRLGTVAAQVPRHEVSPLGRHEVSPLGRHEVSPLGPLQLVRYRYVRGSRHSCSLFPVPSSPRQIRSYWSALRIE